MAKIKNTTSGGRDVEKKEPSYTAGGNANWCSHCGKVWRFFKKLTIELPYDPAIALLRIHPRNMKTLIQRDTCTTIFTAALLIVAKLWRQPKCPLTDEWIQEMWDYIQI